MVDHPNLPSFLVPFGESTESSPHQAVFNHPALGSAHTLWWNSDTQRPAAIFFFIPGNPGLVGFYTQFLNSVHSKHPGLAIFAHAHLAHTPSVQAGKPNGAIGLVAQVQSAIEALDAVRAVFGQTKIIISGHSVGAWIALQVMKARPSDVYQAFMLCPTLEHIADTPNGRRLHWLFRSPFPTIISYLSYLTRPLPLSLLFRNWPSTQVADTTLLDEHRDHIYLYFAEEDEWVSTHKATVLHSFMAGELARIVEGRADVPHAFRINHSEEVADQCSLWLSALDI
ncbi:hypothetical protein DFH09DRAFT_1122824 [Mycena vulgaris]|nr:hypothetical protein DFH09DRAFT_1122824 [Mycena vulgaris]